MKLLETSFAARMRLGEPVIGELEAAVAAHPYQERLWELLIAALYDGGRQADALAAYRRVRARLADDLGLEPGPRLRELERQVLEHDAGLRAPAGNLPSLGGELVGRDAEVAGLAALLERVAAGGDRRARRRRQDRAGDRHGPGRSTRRSGWCGSSPRTPPTRCSTP